MSGHARVQQDGLFLCLRQQGFKVLPPRCDPGEVVLDFRGRNAVLDCLNDVVAGLGDLCEFSFGRAKRSILLVAQFVQVARVLAAKFFKQRGIHQARLQCRDHHPFERVLPDRQVVPQVSFLRAAEQP